jgi:hypothetical protein
MVSVVSGRQDVRFRQISVWRILHILTSPGLLLRSTAGNG